MNYCRRQVAEEEEEEEEGEDKGLREFCQI